MLHPRGITRLQGHEFRGLNEATVRGSDHLDARRIHPAARVHDELQKNKAVPVFKVLGMVAGGE
jgi:hypothetical protein